MVLTSENEVLRAVAKILDCNGDDRSRVAYRYGGEELALVLTGEDATTAMEMAESIRTDVEQLWCGATRLLVVGEGCSAGGFDMFG